METFFRFWKLAKSGPPQISGEPVAAPALQLLYDTPLPSSFSGTKPALQLTWTDTGFFHPVNPWKVLLAGTWKIDIQLGY